MSDLSKLAIFFALPFVLGIAAGLMRLPLWPSSAVIGVVSYILLTYWGRQEAQKRALMEHRLARRRKRRLRLARTRLENGQKAED